MTIISMSEREIDRFEIISRLRRGEINGPQAARTLALSTRQVQRLKKRVKKQGARGLIHRNRGRPSNRRLPSAEEQRISHYLQHDYPDFGPTLAAEKLSERQHIPHDPKTISRIMVSLKLWQPKQKRRSAPHREWRPRKQCFGEMIQFDGSYHNWFEDRGPEVCLLAAIDDATGNITGARFALHEGVLPVFTFWKRYLERQGKPRAIYLDKFSTYRMNNAVAQENHELLTQFQRATGELRINLITAHSPQAKGRVEKLFETLQDRLVKELRLAGISTIDEANLFLERTFIPQFNAKFAVPAALKTNLHLPLTVIEKSKLSSIFSRQTSRVIQNDFTISFDRRWYQLVAQQSVAVFPRESVIVEELLDGTIKIRLRGKYLNYRVLPARPKRVQKQPWVLAVADSGSKAHKPALNHPWRHDHRFQSAKSPQTRTFLLPAK